MKNIPLFKFPSIGQFTRTITDYEGKMEKINKNILLKSLTKKFQGNVKNG